MKRNPRRAYDKHGGEVRPATVDSHLSLGLHMIEIHCYDCHHHRHDIDISGLPGETPLPDICLSYRCSKCGSKNLMSRGDVHEHYEQVEAARKGSKPSSAGS